MLGMGAPWAMDNTFGQEREVWEESYKTLVPFVKVKLLQIEYLNVENYEMCISILPFLFCLFLT